MGKAKRAHPTPASLEPLAASWETWVLKESDEVQPPPPVVYDTPAYWQEVEEVLAISRALTAEQKRIAEAWNLDQGSVTPAGVWNRKARDLIQAADLDTLRTAQVLAVLNIAMADAVIASWRAKFTYWTQRPVTAIRERFDPEWLPLILTPPFPSYVSTHATLSGAAAAVLAAFFPQAAGSLQAAAEEAALSRLYAGIHFRSDNEAGLTLGRRIGRLVVDRYYGQP
ncbi:MAG: vanadium-dependent haloperoxidase [Candidatus Competibacteraceae bacterium]